MPTVTLYRATNRTDGYGSGACFAADEEHAEAYLDNPGHGGAELIEVEVEVDTSEVLSLVDSRRDGLPHGRATRDAWRRLADALGLEDTDDRPAWQLLRDQTDGRIEDVIDGRKARDQLAAAGYRWVVYEDTYPAGCVTWVYVGRDAVVL